MNKIFVIIAIFLLSISSAKAANPKTYEISGIDKWFNSKPLQKADLAGKIVLVDFWTYSCINCIRGLPHLIELDKKYRDSGLVVIGVHTPEFDFEKNYANIEKSIKRYGIKYPVAVDNSMKTWNNFDNHYWPAQYLINKDGKLVYYHFGESDADILENKVASLINSDLKPSAKKNTAGQFSQSNQTPEIYLGSERSQGNVNQTESSFKFPDIIPKNSWALQGKWKIRNQFAESENNHDAIKINFTAKKVFLVMSSVSGKSIKVKILLDGKEIEAADYGDDVVAGEVAVKDSRLYNLVNLQKKESGILELEVVGKGLRAYAFTFGMN